MRIACLHVPQFALQCVTRAQPSLRGAPVVVVGTPDLRTARGEVPRIGHPVVQACSRAAWALGARVGMAAAAARTLSPELVVISADVQLERETLRALADVLLGLAPVVDVGGRVGPGAAHLAMYCEVPTKTRGTSFGERVLEKLEVLGLTGRLGIADDRFTAWVAASSPGAEHKSRDEDSGVISVPRGGSAAFLAPRPLSLLSIPAEVQHMLEALGVRTLGEFAALPAPSVTRPIEADYQALARGESGHSLRPYAPEAAIREEMILGPGNAAAIPEAVAALAERLAVRLAGRGRAAARLDLVVVGEAGERTIAIDPIARPIAAPASSLESLLAAPRGKGNVVASAEGLAELLSAALSDTREAWRLRVVVTGEALAAGEPVEAEQEVAAPAIVDTLSLVLSSTGGSLDLAFGPAFSQQGTPAPERRFPPRRLRRGKERQRIQALVQPKLFKV